MHTTRLGTTDWGLQTEEIMAAFSSATLEVLMPTVLSCCCLAVSQKLSAYQDLRLLLGAEAPVTTPNCVDFSFLCFSSVNRVIA